MTNYNYDLFVIGAGSGGVRAARMAAQKGVKVAVAEDSQLGGTCVNVGCVPKKLLVYASQFAEEFQQAKGFGWTVGGCNFDWPTLITNKNTEIIRLNGVYGTLLENAGVDLLRGRAAIEDSHTVQMEGRTYTAKTILVAVGGKPFVPDIPGRELAITSNEAFFLPDFPERIIVVGGGYIAVEFAGIFHGLGAEVTQLYRRDLFLRGFDDDLRSFLAEEIQKKGVDLRFNSVVTRLDKTANGIRATLKDGTQLEADVVLYATGRVPNTAGLGLEQAGVKCSSDGAVVVNAQFQSSVPSIYALGDVIDRMALTPVAIREAMVLADNLYGTGRQTMSYEAIPTAVFSQPPIGTVGLTETEAQEQYGAKNVTTFKSEFRPMKHTLGGGEERTLMKLVVETTTDRVLGAHMCGADAGEIIQGLGIALKAGATKALFDATIGVHPTAAEEFVTMR